MKCRKYIYDEKRTEVTWDMAWTKYREREQTSAKWRERERERELWFGVKNFCSTNWSRNSYRLSARLQQNFTFVGIQPIYSLFRCFCCSHPLSLFRLRYMYGIVCDRIWHNGASRAHAINILQAHAEQCECETEWSRSKALWMENVGVNVHGAHIYIYMSCGVELSWGRM